MMSDTRVAPVRPIERCICFTLKRQVDDGLRSMSHQTVDRADMGVRVLEIQSRGGGLVCVVQFEPWNISIVAHVPRDKREFML